MKAVLQNFRTGVLEVADIPAPQVKPGHVLVANAASLISAGTERAAIALAKMSALQKARARPDLVRKVLDKAGQEGMLATFKIVSNLVSAPLPLGYSCAGVVRSVGSGITDLQPGMRVACAGLGYANHAEFVCVPRNLCAPVPDGVSLESASFVTVGAIALHGVRQAQLTLGETVVVLGLGLVGQLTVQICAAAGMRVFGVDVQMDRVALARALGAADGEVIGSPLGQAVRDFTRSRGADAVIVTAGAKDSELIRLAPELLRDRGRVVVVGDVGMEVPRRAYYEKEIEIRLSRSYGPGRYDPGYEEGGHDYPVGYVRWTENRNMEAFLDLLQEGRVSTERLVTHRFKIADAASAYRLLEGGPPAEPYIGIVLEYEPPDQPVTTIELRPVPKPTAAGSTEVRFGIIGAGQFAQGVLLPRLAAIKGVSIRSVATASGLTARSVAKRYGTAAFTSDYSTILADPEVDAVLVATRHDQHARIVCGALSAGKHVFVEKPLAVSHEELLAVHAAWSKSARREARPQLLVGFNRRFSPFASMIKSELSGRPLVMTYRVNAGRVPANHWHQQAEQGGRIVGEVCHFVDLLSYVAGALPVEVFARPVVSAEPLPGDPDNVVITISFADGSVGSILYTSSGSAAFPKERLEVFAGGAVGVIDNWRSVYVQDDNRRRRRRRWLEAAKGHKEELVAFVDGIREGVQAIPIESLLATTEATFAIQRSLRSGHPESVDGVPFA